MFDVLVIGGGVIGATILRELKKYRLSACLLERENDVATGESRANSGIVHAGFDAENGTLKAKFNLLGNEMMPAYCKELGVKYRNNGSLVVAFSQEEIKTLEELKARGEKNGVKGLEIISAKRLSETEPNVSDRAVAALYAPTGGIVCPYELTIAAVGNAMDNGAELLVCFEVVSIEKTAEGFIVKSSDGRRVESKLIINCAGLAGGKIAALAGDSGIKILPRRGEYILLDRESGDFVSHTLFFTPSLTGKGVLISQTVDNNIIIGPTSADTDGTQTSAEGLSSLIEKAKEMCPSLPFYNTITSFAGVRSYAEKRDFIIEESQKVKGFINVVGIESPGLTSAPAIAAHVVQNIVGKILPLEKNEDFNGIRKPDWFFSTLTVEEKNELIKKDPSFGRVVCRCEQITEGELLHAIRANPPARDIDGVKRRTRAGMGRCQGGFCQPHVAELLAKEMNVDLTEVTKSGKNSVLVTGKIK